METEQLLKLTQNSEITKFQQSKMSLPSIWYTLKEDQVLIGGIN